MSDCTRHAPMIGAREGELTAPEQASLSRHLAACARCRALAADLAATEGLVSEALLARAAARDFAPFVDQVMARVGPPARRRGALAWLHAHWKGTLATVVPAVAAIALFMYVQPGGRSGGPSYLELTSEGSISMVLHTSDGPVVLLAPEESGS